MFAFSLCLLLTGLVSAYETPKLETHSLACFESNETNSPLLQRISGEGKPVDSVQKEPLIVAAKGNPYICCEYDCGWGGCRYKWVRQSDCPIVGKIVSPSKCKKK